jgi:hypothetical protein
MNSFIRSLVQSLRADRRFASAQRRSRLPMISESLETRTFMAADLSGGMLGKFNQSYTPGIVTAAGTGTTGASSAGDSNDKITNAKKKSLNFTEDASISSGLDVDLFKFTVKTGQRVTFDIDRPAGSTLDSVLRLFNAAGQEVPDDVNNNDGISDDQGTASEPDIAPSEVASRESFIDYTFAAGGTYYVGVSGTFNDAYNAVSGAGDANSPSTGKYKLVVQKYVNPDGNDTTTNFDESIRKTDSETGTISTPTDVDMYQIKVNAGDVIGFDIDNDLANPLSPLDSFLRLFDDNGVQLAANDDGDDPTEAAEDLGHSYFQYTFTQSGTYYIAVSGKGNELYNPLTGAGDTAGSTGKYTLLTTLLN